MLVRLEIEKFKCFKKHLVPLEPLSILVGSNNAGKSTIVEALRLLAVIVSRYRNLTYGKPPAWTDYSSRLRGVSPSTKGLNLRGLSAIHRYGEPPATITAYFANGSSVEVLVGHDYRVFGIIRNQEGVNVRSKADAKRVDLPSVSILPQVEPLADTEVILSEEYVRKSINTHLNPRHFRNQLNLLYDEYYEAFRQLAESSWPGLRIDSLDGHEELPETQLNLLVRDGSFVAEVAWMGHGLQMWLQTMWFLARSVDATTIILDEPDVYMHADLQRKLVRLLRGRHPQTIIATHSVEIMSEVGASNILIVDKSRTRSRFATSLPAVQRVIDNMGGVHNIHLTRLWNAHKCLLVEGKDVRFLRVVQDLLFPDSNIPLEIVPRIEIGGWGGWQHTSGAALTLKNAADESIVPYCILDSDYHPRDAIEERYEEATTRDIRLHIWRRKEIENYLLVPSAMLRIIRRERDQDAPVPDEQIIRHELERITTAMRDQVFDALAQESLARNRGGGAAAANRAARERLDEAWASLEGKMAIVSGKSVLSAISRWSQENYGVSLGAPRIISELSVREVDQEMKQVIRCIERGQRFPASLRVRAAS